MLSTVAGVTLVATLVSGYRNTRQWETYHQGHLTRGQLTNKVFVTVVLAVATAILFVLGRFI